MSLIRGGQRGYIHPSVPEQVSKEPQKQEAPQTFLGVVDGRTLQSRIGFAVLTRRARLPLSKNTLTLGKNKIELLQNKYACFPMSIN